MFDILDLAGKVKSLSLSVSRACLLVFSSIVFPFILLLLIYIVFLVLFLFFLCWRVVFVKSSEFALIRERRYIKVGFCYCY